ncbi:hypothetical protein ANRL4_01527 [Anaerolineae bacterium]|nr:hypothetical protein ANRL4_01527 [Anaerolineae bacterium]
MFFLSEEWTIQDYETTWGILKQSTPTYGDPFGGSGTAQTGFGFTGEPTDASGLVYLRARYYVPGLGVFPSLDPVEEGNRYGYVGRNVVNRVDPSGECPENPAALDIFGWRCRYLAENLAARLGKAPGTPEYQKIMSLPYGDLEAITAISTLNDAAIIPMLIRQDPLTTVEALNQWVCQRGGLLAALTFVAKGVVERLPIIGLALPELGIPTRLADFIGVLSLGLSLSQQFEDINAQRKAIAKADETAQTRDSRDPFDLAFGVNEYLGRFAAALPRRTLPFYSWPDWMVRADDGIHILMIGADPNILINNLDAIITGWVWVIPEGRIKFNLAKMDGSAPTSVTTRELKKVVSRWQPLTDFYLFDETHPTPMRLVGIELAARLGTILAKP